MSRLRIVVLLMIVSFAGCNKFTSPSSVDPDWPDPNRGTKPVAVSKVLIIPPERGSVNIQRITPSENSVGHVGQTAQVWTVISNNTDQFLAISVGASDGPDDNPGLCGRDSSVFHPSSLFILKPGESKEVIFGFDANRVDDIPYLRLAGYFNKNRNFQVGPWTTPDWTLDFHLGWSIR